MTNPSHGPHQGTKSGVPNWLIATFVVVGLLVFVIGKTASETSSIGETEKSMPAASLPVDPPKSACGAGGIATRRDFAVRDEDILRTQPQVTVEPVGFDVGGVQVPAPLETSAQVREVCRAGDWSRVQVLSLTDHSLEGWVPSARLRKVPTTAAGKRIYERGDFTWPDGSGPVRKAVVEIANRIIAQRSECRALDTENLVLIGPAERGTFSLPCFAGTEMVSFDFRAADAKSGRSFAPPVAVEPIEKMAAFDACQEAILARSAHPSTVSVSAMDYEFTKDEVGNAEARTTFTGKNSFGLELNFRAVCSFQGTALTNVILDETS